MVKKETEEGEGIFGYMFRFSVIWTSQEDVVVRTTWIRRGYSVSHMIIGLLEMVSFNGSNRFDRLVDTQGPLRSGSDGPKGGR